MPTLGNKIVRASDCSLQEWVEGLGSIPSELQEPIAIDGKQVVLTGRVEDALDWMILIEFTDSGEVQILSDTHWPACGPGPSLARASEPYGAQVSSPRVRLRSSND